MNAAISGFSEAFAVVVCCFAPSATEKAFKLALKFATKQRQGKLADSDVLRLLSKASTSGDEGGQAFNNMTRRQLQQAVFVLQLLASEAVTLGVAGDAFGKRLVKAVEKASPPLSTLLAEKGSARKEALTETIAALSSAVTEESITLNGGGAASCFLDTPAVHKLSNVVSSGSGNSGKRKNASAVAFEFTVSGTLNDSSTSRAFAARRLTSVPVSEVQAVALLSAVAAAESS